MQGRRKRTTREPTVTRHSCDLGRRRVGRSCDLRRPAGLSFRIPGASAPIAVAVVVYAVVASGSVLSRAHRQGVAVIVGGVVLSSL